MAYVHDLTITDRIRVAPSKAIGDDSVQENVIESVVCIAKCTDDETNEIASTDPWVTIDLTDLTASDFVAFDDLTGLPTRAKTQLEAWGEEQKSGLESQLAARAVASKEQAAPWVA
tara:strand:- start:221 stop:568 length:348 start_codon:yes stop_codon:yes gene_type:complete